MAALVSIIIPTYNRDYLLGQTLDSILDLNFEYWECLVIDDGSRDHTRELMEFYCHKDNRINYYKRPENRVKGANSCRNFGFEKSKGKYINFFDSDDLIDPDKISLQLQNLMNRNLDFSVSNVRFFRNHKSNLTSYNGKIFSDNPFESYVYGQISWLTSSILWNRDFLKKQNYLFDEELRASQEWEFHIRIMGKNPNFHLIETPLVFMRKHKENITYGQEHWKQKWNYYLARLKVFHNNDIQFSDDSKTYLRRYLMDGFKEFTRNRKTHAWNAFKMFILKEQKVSMAKKINAILGIISYRLFGRGNLFLNKLNF